MLYKGVIPLTVIGPVNVAPDNKATVLGIEYSEELPLTVIAPVKAAPLSDAYVDIM